MIFRPAPPTSRRFSKLDALRRRGVLLWHPDLLDLGTSDSLPFDGTLFQAAIVYRRRLDAVGAAASVVLVLAAVVGAVWLLVQALDTPLAFVWVVLVLQSFSILLLSKRVRFTGPDPRLPRREAPDVLEAASERLQFLVRSEARCAYAIGIDRVYVRWSDPGGRVYFFSARGTRQMLSELQSAATEDEICAVIGRHFDREIRHTATMNRLFRSVGESRPGSRPQRWGS